MAQTGDRWAQYQAALNAIRNSGSGLVMDAQYKALSRQYFGTDTPPPQPAAQMQPGAAPGAADPQFVLGPQSNAFLGAGSMAGFDPSMLPGGTAGAGEPKSAGPSIYNPNARSGEPSLSMPWSSQGTQSLLGSGAGMLGLAGGMGGMGGVGGAGSIIPSAGMMANSFAGAGGGIPGASSPMGGSVGGVGARPSAPYTTVTTKPSPTLSENLGSIERSGLYQDLKKQQDAANAANQSRYADMLGLDEAARKELTTHNANLFNQQMGLLEGSENSALAQSGRQSQQDQAQVLQEMIRRGLGGTSILPALQLQTGENQRLRDLNIGNQANQQRLGVVQDYAGRDTGQRLAGFNRRLGIMGDRTDQAPDISRYLQLIMAGGA